MTPRFKSQFLAAFATFGLVFTGCASDSGPDDSGCTDGKCDDPGSTADRECRDECQGSDDANCFQDCRDARALGHCEARRSDAMDSSQIAFTKDAIRWACSDVEGVNTNNRDDRGQEYCEYYAVVQPPPAVEGDSALPDAVTLGRNRSNRPATPLALDLTEDQIFQLEDNPDRVVGQCVFTSWHQDINIPLPVCNGSEATCPNLSFPDSAAMPSWMGEDRSMNIPLMGEYMRMKVSINSNNAAADLFEKCLSDLPAGDPNNADDPLHDPYVRGCMHSYSLFKTEWRRSDPSVCVVGQRLAECGCGVDLDLDGVADIAGDAKAISRAVVPFQPGEDGSLKLRGFHLGTWSGKDQLPTGCRYVETGDTESTSTLVQCDLTGSDILANPNDPKGMCRTKYGDNVVVHVPVPSGNIVCTPDPDGQYTDSCGAMPWMVGNEGEPTPTPDPDPEPETACYDICTEGASPTAECRSNDECIEAVCAADSFCCDTSWDGKCVTDAQANSACSEYSCN